MAKNSSFKRGRVGLPERAAVLRTDEGRGFALVRGLLLIVFGDMEENAILGLMRKPSKSGKGQAVRLLWLQYDLNRILGQGLVPQPGPLL